MDVVKAIQGYINKMVSETQGMKTPIISVVCTQSYLLSKEVYLIDKLENANRDTLKHLKCICFVRPSAESLQSLADELRNPKYGEYFLYFSNVLKKSQVERLAEVDECEVVREVQEYYADYLAINADLFTLNLTAPTCPLYSDLLSNWDARAFQRALEGLSAVLLSLKKRPLIRYERFSQMSKRLGQELQYLMQQEHQLFDFRRTDSLPVLLILDRRNDPITPLLTQWTYQAMVHELLGIINGRVDLSHMAEVSPDLKEVVLAADSDPFFQKNMFLNFGDLGFNIKTYVNEYQSKTKTNMNIESIADMKRFVEEYPEFKRLSGNVSKHVALVGELSRIVDKYRLLEVGELEQSLACSDNHRDDLESLQKMIQREDIPDDCKVKLVILYALRYEKHSNNATPRLLEMLSKSGVDTLRIGLVETMVKYGGADVRQDDLFQDSSLISKGKNVFRGLKGVENVYTQHTPHMAQTLELITKGRLKETTHPFIETQGLNQAVAAKDRVNNLIIFVVGGATYEEAKYINQLMTSTPGLRIVLGGTAIHNSQSFLREVFDALTVRTGAASAFFVSSILRIQPGSMPIAYSVYANCFDEICR
ncbi:vacuolar protein sorting-associated protein 45 [Sorochytrium milnesiophthora]